MWVTVKVQYQSFHAGTSNHRLLIDTSLPISGSVQHMAQPRLKSPCMGNKSALEPQGFGFEVTGSFIASYFAVGPAGESTAPEWQSLGWCTYESLEPQHREPGEYRLPVPATKRRACWTWWSTTVSLTCRCGWLSACPCSCKPTQALMIQCPPPPPLFDRLPVVQSPRPMYIDCHGTCHGAS